MMVWWQIALGIVCGGVALFVLVVFSQMADHGHYATQDDADGVQAVEDSARNIR